jgi:hypothetical protein
MSISQSKRYIFKLSKLWGAQIDLIFLKDEVSKLIINSSKISVLFLNSP